jgi:anti-anti-sigma factor
MGLKIEVKKSAENDPITVSLIGSLDTETYTEFENKINPILTPFTKGIMLNMEGLTYISSIGLASIFRAKQALEKNGSTLALANLQPNVKKIFDAVKVIPEHIFATLQEADDYLDKYIAFINSDRNKR